MIILNEYKENYGKISSNEIPCHSNRFFNFFGVCGEECFEECLGHGEGLTPLHKLTT
jgi:hypothetical protein